MNEEINMSASKNIYGFITVFVGFAITCILLTKYFHAYPNKPFIASYLLAIYLMVQVANRLPLIYKWVFNISHITEFTLYLISILIFIILAFGLASLSKSVLLLVFILNLSWLIFRYILIFKESEPNLPMFNKLVGTTAAAFFETPIVIATWVSLSYAA